MTETKEQIEEQWLRSKIIPKIVNGKLLSTYDKDIEFKIHSIDVKFIGTDEAFMLTSCYKAKIDFEYKGNRETRTLVVKVQVSVTRVTFQHMETKAQVEEQWLRTILTTKLIGKVFASEDKMENLKLYTIKISFIGYDESSMLTNCYRAQINYELENIKGTKSILIKKTPEIPEEFFDSINFRALFSNEIEAYTAIVPALLNFSKTKINVPKYYYGDLQRNSATIILEDFNAAGFRMSNDRTNIKLDHMLLMVKYLATFHGICYALKQTDRKLFDTIISNLKESRYATPELHPDWIVTLKYSLKRLRTTARKYHPEISEEFLDKFINLVSDNYRYAKKLVEPIEPMATLCHGDYLRNNVAFKYEEDTESPIDVMMFDLQTVRYSSPMIDLTVCLAISTFAEVRHTHFDEIFDTYCKQLATTYVEHTQQELPAFLSQESLLKEYIRFLPHSCIISGFFVMTLFEPDTISMQEMLSTTRTTEEIAKDVMERGGETIDRELAHQMKELYDLSRKYNVDICEGFDV